MPSYVRINSHFDPSGGPMTAQPTLQEFADECDRFFSEHRRLVPRDAAFTWGEGSDRIALFDEMDPEVERAIVDELRAWRRSLWAHDLGWIAGPTEYGGRCLPSVYQQVFDRQARHYDVPGSAKLVISVGMIAPTILVHGSPASKRRYLAALHSGDLIACQLFSEPAAGSDLASIASRAERDGDGWRLNGQKVWTSGAQYSDIGEVLCKTGGGERHRNLTAFIVDMSAPGVEVRPLRQMTGGAAFNEVFLTDVWVPDEDRLGEVDAGWSVALTTLSNERAALGGAGFGGAGLLSLDRYRQMLQVMGDVTDPVMRQRFADLVINFRVAKYNRNRAAAVRRAGQTPGPEGSIGKLQLSENYRRIAEFVAAVLGPRLAARTEEWGTFSWVEFVLGVPGMRLGGGTDEIMKNVLAERVLDLPKG